MSTTQAQIAADLAIVGRASRLHPIALDATLAVVVAGKPRHDMSIVVMGHVFAQRVARIATGAALTAFMMGLLGYLVLCLRSTTSADFDTAVDRHLLVWWLFFVVQVAAFVLLIHAGAAGRAALHFERTLSGARDPSARARQLVRRVDAWSLICAIVGATLVLLFLGALVVDLKIDDLAVLVAPADAFFGPALKFFPARPRVPETLMLLALAFGAAVVLAVLVVRLARRPRAVLAGASIAVVGLVGLARMDDPFASTITHAAITVLATLAVVGLVGVLALMRRRSEERAMGGDR